MTITTTQSTQRQTALTFLETFRTLDSDTNISLRTPACIHTMLPASLGYPSMTNDQYAAHFTPLKRILSAFPVTPVEVWEAGNQVTIYATSEAVFREEVIDGDEGDWVYQGEYMFVLLFNEVGDGIERVVEFLDSSRVEGIRGLMGRALRNLDRTAREDGAK